MIGIPIKMTCQFCHFDPKASEVVSEKTPSTLSLFNACTAFFSHDVDTIAVAQTICGEAVSLYIIQRLLFN